MIRRVAGFLLFLFLAGPLAAQQAPTRSDIAGYIRDRIPETEGLASFGLGVLDFKSFGGAAGKGWISAAGSLVLQDPLFRRSGLDDLHRVLTEHGIPDGRVSAAVTAAARAHHHGVMPEVFTVAVPSGYRLAFQANLKFTAKGAGFVLSGGLSAKAPEGRTRPALPAAALVIPSPAFDRFVQETLALYRQTQKDAQNREQAIKARQGEVQRFLADRRFDGMTRTDRGWVNVYDMTCGQPTGWRFEERTGIRGHWTHADCTVRFKVKGRVAERAYEAGQTIGARLLAHVFAENGEIVTRAVLARKSASGYDHSGNWLIWTGKGFGADKHRIIAAQPDPAPSTRPAPVTLSLGALYDRLQRPFSGQMKSPGKPPYTLSLSQKSYVISAEYGTLGCGGHWAHQQVDGATHHFREILTKGLDRCENATVVSLTPLSDGSLVLTRARAIGGAVIATGRLSPQ